MKTPLFFAGLFVLLLGLAFFLPGNPITGEAVEPCPDCLDFCENDGQCGRGQTCCATAWETGVCGYDCKTLGEYSEYQDVETYKDTLRGMPPEIHPGWKLFFLPMLAVLGAVAFIAARK